MLEMERGVNLMNTIGAYERMSKMKKMRIS